MSRRTTVLLLLALAGGFLYGGFIVPWLMSAGTAVEEQSEDLQEDQSPHSWLIAPPLIEEKLQSLIAKLDSANFQAIYTPSLEFERRWAATELGKLGPDAAPAIPALIRALESRKALTRPYIGGSFTFGDQTPPAAREALVRIGAGAIPTLTKAMKSDDALVRVNAAWALWRLNKQSRIVLPVLLDAWRDKDLFVADECIRHSATEALGEIGQAEPDRIVPILLASLRDEETVYAAIVSLRLIGPQENVVKALVALLQDTRGGVGNHAGHQLRQLGKAVVPALVTALGDKDPAVRRKVAWTLGGMEPDQAESARDALKTATEDGNEEVRKSAAWALKQISSEPR